MGCNLLVTSLELKLPISQVQSDRNSHLADMHVEVYNKQLHGFCSQAEGHYVICLMVKVKFTFEQAMKAIKALDGGE
jgi:hypothetical protein